ncbi:hypothetical protein B0H19DRAFT_1068725 [Mycena capillaripes]|nr:hypothetical protein B0H19DRAFT_1086464 [Mycena capillaripes]KAJ6562036.1 hypothetical protein B0H19DRAFT_1068725 [Mycena capillaripes]
MSNHDNVYTVLGGTNPGVVARPPFLSGHKDAPIMPIVIKSTNAAEATAALDLHKIFQRLDVDKVEEQPDAFARAIAGSGQISDIYATSGPFYAVYRGKTERAIYVRNFKPDVEAQVHDNNFAKYHRFESIKEALVYMVLKGNLQRMRDLGLYVAKDSSASTYSSPKKALQNQPKTMIIDSHIRDFTGIINTIYGSTTTPTYKLYTLGKHAGYYLQAHGYTETTIQEIQKLWANSADVDTFIEHLTSRGMPAAEIRWLWDLIRHDDNCGN